MKAPMERHIQTSGVNASSGKFSEKQLAGTLELSQSQIELDGTFVTG